MRIRPAAAGLLVVLLAACSPFDVKVDRDPSVDPGRFRSWAWLPPKLTASVDQRMPDPYLGEKLMAKAEGILDTKGYTRDAADRADLFVNYRLTIDRASYDIPYLYQTGAIGARPDPANVDEYQHGTLLIDVIDARSRVLVWRGTAFARLLTVTSLDKRVRRTEEAVEQILATFPPRGQ